jgi:hypothetical protein
MNEVNIALFFPNNYSFFIVFTSLFKHLSDYIAKSWEVKAMEPIAIRDG